MNRIATALAAVVSLFPIATLHAQTPVASTAAIAPPMFPLIANYRYWPVQFIQWVGAELPYSMVELDVDPNGKHPMLYVTLTDRASGKRIHYTDDDGLIAAATAMGEEAHKTALAYEPADTENPGAVTTIRFAMADGKPLQWRFVQGSDISEQGSGLSPLPDAKLPIFAYREQAAVAGEGTALQIGDTVSTAAMWTEISHPPQFIAYRGALTEGAHLLVFAPGRENWTITLSPSTLTGGAVWNLDEAHGDHRTLHIDKVAGAHVTITSTDSLRPNVRAVLEATRSGDAWTLDRVRFSPVRDGEKHFLTLQFPSPPSTGASSTPLSLLAGKKTIASGTLTLTGEAADRSGTLSFSNPAWLSGKTVEATIALHPVTASPHP